MAVAKKKLNFIISMNVDKAYTRSHPFEGIIPNMERRYHETDSEAVREELAKYLTTSRVQTCQGTRLRIEARHVFIDRNEFAGNYRNADWKSASNFFHNLNLPVNAGNCRKNLKRN